jgi:hypothetical protein
MARSPRPHKLLVRLTDAERAELERRSRETGLSRAAILRSALTKAPLGAGEPPTREEVLGLLLEQAREGNATAAASLARELRIEPPSDHELPDGPVSSEDLRAELRRIK